MPPLDAAGQKKIREFSHSLVSEWSDLRSLTLAATQDRLRLARLVSAIRELQPLQETRELLFGRKLVRAGHIGGHAVLDAVIEQRQRTVNHVLRGDESGGRGSRVHGGMDHDSRAVSLR